MKSGVHQAFIFYMNVNYRLHEDRFWNFIRVDEKECWLWKGSKRDGYGRFRVGSKLVQAHVYAFEMYGGVIPEGNQLDHKCFVRACVNPAHLEPVTQKENLRRSQHRRFDIGSLRRGITHCPKGHELSGDNLLMSPQSKRKDYCRKCRTCQYETKRLSHKRRRERKKLNAL